MKKRYLLLMSLMAGNFMSFAQFTENRLVVSQYGDGTAPDLDGTVTVPVFLKEYKTTANNASTYTVTMPTANDQGGAGNKPLTGTFSAASEGLITLSPNGLYISVIGYGNPSGTISADADLRSIGLVTATGGVNTTTYVNSSANNLANPRCAITTDGTGFWAIGSSGGVRYKALGSGTVTTTAIATTPGAMRSITIFNNKIYESTNSSAGAHIGVVSDGLPISGSSHTVTALPGLTGSGTVAPTSPNQLAFLRMATGAGDPDLLYTSNNPADEGDIEKWVLTGGTWVQKGTIRVSTTATRLGVSGITAQYEPSTGNAYIYAVTSDKLLKITDADAATSTINITDNAPEVLATAPANTMFRGVALTPGSSTTLPVKLTSFTGKQQQQTVKLNWTTASEQNNAYFGVLHATDGANFSTLEKVIGNGTSNAPHSYSFVDENPSAGTNYYQLNQVDFNGQSEKSGVIAVKTDLKASTLSVFLSEDNQVQANIYSANTTTAQLSVTDITGRKLASASINLTKGYNKASLNLPGIQPGVYVASIIIDGQTQSVKFIK